jgi:hypothetical protein
MAAQVIHVERPRRLELWHDDRRGDPREDRLVAVSVELARTRAVERAAVPLAGWPVPILDRRGTPQQRAAR